MAVLDGNGDELVRIWGLISDLSEQLNQNRALTASLQAQAGHIKSQALHSETGFPLRRFNLDMSKEAFEWELERMNATFSAENATLQHDNKQLIALWKEYEATLETVMSKFRTHAHATQQHELSVTRHYETALLSRDTIALGQDLTLSTATDQALSRISHLLRFALRSACGEDPEAPTPPRDDDLDSRLEYTELGHRNDWALERECELVRLETENEELRRMVKQMMGVEDAYEPGRADRDKAELHDPTDPRSFTGFRAPMLPRRFKRGPGGLGVYNAFQPPGAEWQQRDLWRDRSTGSNLLSLLP